MRLQRGQGRVGQTVRAGPRRNAHVFGLPGYARTQACIAACLVQIQRLAREDQMGVRNALHVHAPELGPAPRRAQIQAGNSPECVAAFDDVDLGGVGGQFGHRNALAGHLLGCSALTRSNRVILCPCSAAAQRRREQRHSAAGGAKNAHACGARCRISMHCSLPPHCAAVFSRREKRSKRRYKSTEILCSSP